MEGGAENFENLAVLVARVWVGIVMFAHGWRHVKALRSGPGMANWLGSLGLRSPALQAQTLTWTEVALGPILVLGLITPIAYGAAASLMLVALITNHIDKGFFITARPTEGWEYVATLAVLSICLGALGPGDWSLDHSIGWTWPFENDRAFLITAIVGIGGTALYLLTFWRPPKKTADSA